MDKGDSKMNFATLCISDEWKLWRVLGAILYFVLNIFLKLFFVPKIFHLNFCIWAEIVFQCFL